MDVAQCSTKQPAVESINQGSNMNAAPISAPLTVHTPMTPISTNHRIEMWRSRNFDSGFQTMNSSEAPSMISSLHPMSHMSGMSSVADFEQTQLTDQQQMKFDGIPFCPESQYGSAVRAIPELTQLMKDCDHAVVYKAVYIMQNIAKMDSDTIRRQKPVITDTRVIVALRDVLKEKMQFPNIVRVALGTIFHICNRTDGLELVAHVANSDPELLTYIVHHMNTVQFSCYKYAILTFHSLLSDKQTGPHSVQTARRINALQPVTRWLEEEKSEKLLPVIVDLVRLLCDKQNDLRVQFLNADGARKLLNVIRSCTYENLLWRTTQLLKAFSNFDAQRVVESGARGVLAPLLAHDSERLTVATLECLRNLSDVPSGAEDENLLHSLLALLGVRMPMVMLYTVQIISNMCANNKQNKEFFVRNHAVEHFLRVLVEETAFPAYTHLSNKEAQMLEELTESILSTLRHLSVGHSMVEQVHLAVLRQPHVLLDKLVGMRPVLLKHTLNLLAKASSLDANLAVFQDYRSGHLCFVEQIVHILKVACNQLTTHDQIEGVKVRDLIHVSVSLLHLLSRGRKLLDQIVYFLKHPENKKVNDIEVLLPVFILQRPNMDDGAKKTTLLLISKMLYHENIADDLENDQSLHLVLHHVARNSIPDTASLADNLYKEIKMNAQLPQSSNFPFQTNMQDFGQGFNNLGQLQQNEENAIELADEVMDGAGEQWPQDLATTDDPFVNVFCSKDQPQNSPKPNLVPAWKQSQKPTDNPLPGPCNSPSYPLGHQQMQMHGHPPAHMPYQPAHPMYWHPPNYDVYASPQPMSYNLYSPNHPMAYNHNQTYARY